VPPHFADGIERQLGTGVVPVEPPSAFAAQNREVLGPGAEGDGYLVDVGTD